MSLNERIVADITEAMRAKDAGRLSTLRMVKANLMNRKIEKGGELTDEEVQKALQSLVKQRRDSIEQYENAGRTELAEKEAAEIVHIEAYLPQSATAEEIEIAVAEAVAETAASSMKEMGTVMKAAQAKLAGKTADGKLVSEAVKAKLQLQLPADRNHRRTRSFASSAIMAKTDKNNSNSWLGRKLRERGRRAFERQLAYQEEKAAGFDAINEDLTRNIFLRSQSIRQKLEKAKAIKDSDKVLEVGSGAHGLVFGFANNFGVGVDPLAIDYKRLFPKWQKNARTVAAIGEQLPFADASFDVVLSDNVIDHAEQPLKIVDELVRVLKPGAVLYFTVNVHHPFYDLVSRAHGFWNAVGLKFELSPFADHTAHFTERRMRDVFAGLSIKAVSEMSTVAETKRAQRNSKEWNPDALLKKIFFKNALFELVAVKAKLM